jgi:exonuclease VII large subunit
VREDVGGWNRDRGDWPRMRRLVERRRLGLEGLAGQLHALSPLATMSRGCGGHDAGRRLIASAGAVAAGDEVHLRFRDGTAVTQVQSVMLHASMRVVRRSMRTQ